MASSNNTAQWFGIIFLAIVSVALGLGLGFFSQALLPVKTFTGKLPDDTAKKKADIPNIYWLKAYTTRSIGTYKAREKEILEDKPSVLTDREIGAWMNRVFVGDEALKEDVDAKLGTPFIRIGGQGRDDAGEPVLTVTIPYKLKIASLPVSEIPLQFTAKPSFDGGATVWEIVDVHLGHARVPISMKDRVVQETIDAIAATKPEAAKMWDKLAKYRRVGIRDNKLVLESPSKS